MLTFRIAIAATDDEIAACQPVMAELRPHIAADEFVPLVRHLHEVAGLELAYLDDGGVRAVAGFRIGEWLAGGKYLEIEDLVTAEGVRSRGHGSALFDWLVDHARVNGCRQVRLVSHVRRVDAHRFYVRKGMKAEAHYFSLDV
jgi:GNAT superfamily N-acetyltransferase